MVLRPLEAGFGFLMRLKILFYFENQLICRLSPPVFHVDVGGEPEDQDGGMPSHSPGKYMDMQAFGGSVGGAFDSRVR